MNKTYNRYKKELLANGFTEAKKKDGHFYRQAASQTAFVINLENNEFCVDILYGFASTACMLGDEDYFSNYGSNKDDCHIRKIISVSKENEEAAKQIIKDLYNKYKSFTKDEILSLKKECQKEFLNNFAKVLKPLGFKKKGTKWSRELENGYFLFLDAQKSAFSDEYYFNVIIKLLNESSVGCFYTRVVMGEQNIYNWQLMSDKQIETLVNYTLDNYITPILNTPLQDLGKNKSICNSCYCERNKCANCWLEHNHWQN